jgi:hypothetical protein
MKYREHPGYRELLARARNFDPQAHVVCSETRDRRWSVKLTTTRLSVLVRFETLDGAIEAVWAAMGAVL